MAVTWPIQPAVPNYTGNGAAFNIQMIDWNITYLRALALAIQQFETDLQGIAPNVYAALAGVRFRGAYNAGTLYAIGDAVSYGTGIYLKQTNAAAGTTPVAGADWYFVPADPFPNRTGNDGKLLGLASGALAWQTVLGLPAVAGQSGKFVTNNGSAVSWADILQVPAVAGQGGKLLTNNGTVPSWASFDTPPPGLVSWFAASTPPTGWMKCNGATVSRSTYAALFTAISTTFGAGDGSTTFKLPDLRGEFIRGIDDGRGILTSFVGTAQDHALQSHDHTIQIWQNTGTGDRIGNTSATNPVGTAVTSAAGYNGTMDTETRPRNVSLLPCIKY